MHERCYLSGVTIARLRDLLAAITPDILEVLVPNGEITTRSTTFDEQPPNHGYLLKVDEHTWKGDVAMATLRLEEHWIRKGGVAEAPPDRLGAVWMWYRIKRGDIWVVELWGSIWVEDPTDPVLSVTVQENARVIDEREWSEIVELLRGIPGRIEDRDAPYFFRTSRGKTLYNTDLILRDANDTVVGFTTREGRDAAILCSGRVYWEAEYAGIVSDESFDEVLARAGEGHDLRIDPAQVIAAINNLRPR